MPRIIPAFMQFFDDAGDPLANGWLKFTVPGTINTYKNTYSDSYLTIANTNPVQLDSSGRCPDVFGTGSYRAVLYEYNQVTGLLGSQIQQFDPVTGSDGSTGTSEIGGGASEIDGGLLDGGYSASELITGIDGGDTIDQWELVYYDTTETKWRLADAVSSGKGPAWGIAVASTSNGEPAVIMTKGLVRYSTWDWTTEPPAILYLSGTVGGLTETAPTSGVLQPVGRALTAEIVYFNFNPITGFGVI